jgi:hypothetical protein
MKCGICHRRDHNAQRCPDRPGRLERIEVPRATADVVLERVRPFLKVMAYAEHPFESLLLAVYLQGALDALYLAERHPQLVHGEAR